MRTHGKLIKWNDERGFGFIETGAGREQFFVHISAFPHDGVRPRIGELVSFEPDQGSDGRKRGRDSLWYPRVMRTSAASCDAGLQGSTRGERLVSRVDIDGRSKCLQ